MLEDGNVIISLEVGVAGTFSAIAEYDVALAVIPEMKGDIQAK
jgi:hypothetical protein